MSAPVVQSESNTTSPGRIRRWIIDHDDRWSFLILYVSLSIVLSIWISLFWLVALVSLHFVFECIKKHYDGTGRPARTTAWAAWDIKFDLALVVVAFVLLIYTSISFGVAGLAGLSRLGLLGSRLPALTRFTQLTKGAGVFVRMPIKDLILASRIACVRKLDRREIRKRREQFYAEGCFDKARADRIASTEYPWQAPWSLTDKLALAFILLNFGIIGLAFLIAEQTPMEIFATVGQQLHPWPDTSPPGGS